MTGTTPIGLLYLLTVGKEKELVLQLHDGVPTQDELTGWMREGAVIPFAASTHGQSDAFTIIVNFGHVVAARQAPYTESRSASF